MSNFPPWQRCAVNENPLSFVRSFRQSYAQNCIVLISVGEATGLPLILNLRLILLMGFVIQWSCIMTTHSRLMKSTTMCGRAHVILPSLFSLSTGIFPSSRLVNDELLYTPCSKPQQLDSISLSYGATFGASVLKWYVHLP